MVCRVKQTTLRDYEAFKPLVDVYDFNILRFKKLLKKLKLESKPQKQTVFEAISEKNKSLGVIE